MSMSLALLAIMLDESDYVERWAKTVEQAHQLGVAFDQVIVIDGGSTDDTVEKLRQRGITVIVRAFDGHFAEQRNFGISLCNTDWIFELDADEYPSKPLLTGLKTIVADLSRDHVQCAGIPRINLLDGRAVEGPGHNGMDYQYRLHRRECLWTGRVHEEISGYTNRVELSLSNGHFILHDKTSVRHEVRNAYYRSLVK
jgi:glycosyltransferase involved in cell wall biosynthesis